MAKARNKDPEPKRKQFAATRGILPPDISGTGYIPGISEFLYRTIDPVTDDIPGLKQLWGTIKDSFKSPDQFYKGNEAMKGSGFFRGERMQSADEQFWRKYLGMPYDTSVLAESPYKPTVSKDKNAKYYRLNTDYVDWQQIVDDAVGGGDKKPLRDYIRVPDDVMDKAFEDDNNFEALTPNKKILDPIRNFKTGLGKDKKGSYVSIYDKYDFEANPVEGAVGKPFEIYDRIYYDEKTGKVKKKMGGKLKEGGMVNAEFEGGEIAELPGGEQFKFKGPKHSEGGIDATLPEGTFIFSDFLKGPDGKTMAEREEARQRKATKVTKKMGGELDFIDRFTIEKTLGDLMQEKMQDMAIQEIASAVDSGNKKEFKKGGELTSDKAKKILKDGKVRGRPLTAKQKRYMGWIAGGKKQFGGPLGALSNLYEILGGIPPSENLGWQAQTGYADQALRPDMSPLPNPIKRPLQGASDTGYNVQPLPTGIKPPVQQTKSPLFFDDVPFGGGQSAGQTEGPPEGNGGGLLASAATGALGGAGLGPAGVVMGAVAPLATTLLNRLGDKGVPNFYENFGQAALDQQAKGFGAAEVQRDLGLQDIQQGTQAAKTAARGSARSINTLRSLESAIGSQGQRQEQQTRGQYIGQLAQQYAQRAQLENEKDRMRMTGAQQSFDESEKQRDNFFTQLGLSLGNLSEGTMALEAIKNQKNSKNYEMLKEMFDFTDIFGG